MSQCTSYACFKCRKHRGLLVVSTFSKDIVSCPQCQEPMKSLGKRLQVPPKDDVAAWNQFWLQYISPGYWRKGEPEIDAENEHFEKCKAKKREPPEGNKLTGCERCDVVWNRMPENEKERWRKRPKRWPGLT